MVERLWQWMPRMYCIVTQLALSFRRQHASEHDIAAFSASIDRLHAGCQHACCSQLTMAVSVCPSVRSLHRHYSHTSHGSPVFRFHCADLEKHSSFITLLYTAS